jgi:uncharacterized membrane protein
MGTAISPQREAKPSALMFLTRDVKQIDVVVVLTAMALLLGSIWRLTVGLQSPLWLDETFTAAIATQPSLRDAFAWIFHDPGEPLYYLVIWAWVHLFGSSDLSLRLPSLVCGLAAPLLLAWRGHPDRDVRFCWASLAALWLPGMYFASEARCYALLFLLACLQTIVFLRLLKTNVIREAWLWTGITSLLILCHYHALIISGIEGIIYLGLRRQEALKNWRSVLTFLPVVAWVGLHLPHALQFGSAGAAWYQTLDRHSLLLLPSALFGTLPFGWLVILSMMGTCMAWALKRLASAARSERQAVGSCHTNELADMAAAIAGIASVVTVLIIGAVHPSFTPRYLTPYMPAFLLGIVLWARAFSAPSRVPIILLLTMWISASSAIYVHAIDTPENNPHYNYNFAEPSAWLQARGARKLIFLWDNPNAPLVGSDRLAQLGGFFFRRNGAAIAVVAPIPGNGVRDPNIFLPALARMRGDAIIWGFDRTVPNSLGIAYSPHFWLSNRDWNCKDFGKDNVSVLACIHA